jgi:uncharacterized protein YndB with AHSA1/START domain
MTGKLQFDFIVDKKNNTMTVRREFAADRQLVWDAYTKKELLEQWFAPQPFTVKTKHMSFKEGGYWHYAMVDPTGPEHWGRMDYTKISPIDSYSGLDAFCNENGDLNPALPRATWDVSFKDKGETTVVETLVTYNSLDELETVINMGMKEGLTMTLDRLDALLATWKKK